MEPIQITFDPVHDPESCHTCCKGRHKPYTEPTVLSVRVAYVLMAILWIFLVVVVLKIFQSDWIGMCILSIPLFIYLLGFINANRVTPEVEKTMFDINYLSLGLLIILPLLA